VRSRSGGLAPLALLAALASLLAAAPPAVAHGGEEAAVAEVPARTLVQQALALQTQQDNAAEALEKLEAALASEHQEDVDLGAVREAIEALEKDDHELAVEHMNAALGAEPEPAAAHEEEKAAAEEGVPEEALEHSPEFEPGRGAEEWIAFGVGVGALLAGLGILALRRTAG